MNRGSNDDDFDFDDGEPERQSALSASERAEAVQAAQARLDRQRRDLSGQVGGAAGEIERLRLKQEELEREKQALQQLARKQEVYERGKREMTEKLSRSVVLLAKEREQAQRMVALLGETRDRFADQLEALERIREDEWVEGDFKDDLEAALAEVEAAKTIYQKALARIEASSWHKGGAARDMAAPESVSTQGGGLPRGFMFWLKAGLAFSLPLILALTVLFLMSLFTSGFWRL